MSRFSLSVQVDRRSSPTVVVRARMPLGAARALFAVALCGLALVTDVGPVLVEALPSHEVSARSV